MILNVIYNGCSRDPTVRTQREAIFKNKMLDFEPNVDILCKLKKSYQRNPLPLAPYARAFRIAFWCATHGLSQKEIKSARFTTEFSEPR